MFPVNPTRRPAGRANPLRALALMLLLAGCSGGGSNAPGGGDPPPPPGGSGGAGGSGGDPPPPTESPADSAEQSPTLSLAPSFTIIDHPYQNPGSDFGVSTCILDFDGDGHADLAVGAEGEDGMRGAVYVFWGPELRQDSFVRIPAVAQEMAGLFGHDVRNGGDLDGLPGDELLVGAPEERTDGLDSAGAAYVLFEGAAPLRIVSCEPEDEAWFGTSLVAGDFEGRGVSQIAVGARGATSAPGVRGGRVELFHLGPFGLVHPGRVLSNPNPSTDASNGNFGRLLVVEPDAHGEPQNLIVPALANPTPEHGDGGLVYVFSVPLSSTPSFALQSPLLHWEAGTGTRLGMVLDATPHRLLAGAPRHDIEVAGPTALENAGCALLFEGPEFDLAPPRVLRRSDHPFEVECTLDLNGYGVALAELVGSDVPDLVMFGLNIHSKHGMSILVYDGEIPSAAPAFIQPLPDSSGHFPEGICHGQLVPGGREELVVGDARYGPGEDRRGRVVLFQF